MFMRVLYLLQRVLLVTLKQLALTDVEIRFASCENSPEPWMMTMTDEIDYGQRNSWMDIAND